MTISDNAIERLRVVADMPDLTGTRYRIVEKLGQGGMGGVYRAEDTILTRQVAMKVLSMPDSSGDLAARLLREARVIAQLEHPGIVPVHDVGTLPDHRVYYTMKLVQGKRLDEYVATIAALPERLRIFQKICEAVSFAHAHGVLHRDLKPQNVMVGAFGEVLVMDWGLSKILQEQEDSRGATDRGNVPGDPTRTSHGAILGTPGYMAPEQARGEVEQLDERADVYALGAILRFLTSSPGLDISNVARRRALAAIAGKATAADPQDRYASVAQLATDVAAYLDGRAVQAFPEGRLALLWRWTARNRAWLLLILAYLLMRVLLLLWRGR